MKKKIMMFVLCLGLMFGFLPAKVSALTAAPRNPRWEGMTAKWDVAEGAKDYAIGVSYGTPEMTAESHVLGMYGISFWDHDGDLTSFDLTEYVTKESGDYYFQVAAIDEDGKVSEYIASEALTICKVSFNTGDQFSLDDQYVVKGETITPPQVSGMPDTMSGWFKDFPADGDPFSTELYDFSAPVTEDMELTAAYMGNFALMTEDGYNKISPYDKMGVIKAAPKGQDPADDEGAGGFMITSMWAAGQETPEYTFLAVPREGYAFVKWMKLEGSGGPVFYSDEPEIEMTPEPSAIMIACFRDEDDIPVTAFGVSPGGTYSVYTEDPYIFYEDMRGPMNMSVRPEANLVTARAEAESGYEFEGWYEGILDRERGFVYEGSDVLITAEAEYTYKSVEHRFLFARFRKKTSGVKPETLKVTPAQLEMPTSDTQQLQVTVTPEGADDNMIWSSSDENVAVVDEYGNVRAKTYGKAVITAVSALDPKLKAAVTVQTRFFDVNDSSQSYYKPVYWGADNGVVAGFEKGAYFGPDDDCTRAQFVTFLWRLAGRPTGTKAVTFTDITGDENYFRAIKWAVSEGIIVGFKHDDGTAEFRPDDKVTRGQTATMLWRYGGRKTPKTGADFSDVKASDNIFRAVSWGQEAGIIKGYKTGEFAGQFRPDDSCLRQHIVTFLYRYARDVMKKKV